MKGASYLHRSLQALVTVSVYGEVLEFVFPASLCASCGARMLTIATITPRLRAAALICRWIVPTRVLLRDAPLPACLGPIPPPEISSRALVLQGARRFPERLQAQPLPPASILSVCS